MTHFIPPDGNITKKWVQHQFHVTLKHASLHLQATIFTILIIFHNIYVKAPCKYIFLLKQQG